MIEQPVRRTGWSAATPAQDPRHLVLLHGLASTPKEFGLLVHPLRRLGVTVHTPEIRGYSHASLSHPARWQDWVDAAVESINSAVGSQPFMLGGLCTGAIVSLAVASRALNPALRGLALMSPIVAYDGWGLPWWYRLRSLAYILGIEERFSMVERFPYGLKNERLRQWVRQQMQDGQATLAGTPRVSLQLVRESERVSRHVPAWMAGLNVPTIVLHAREDEICSLASVRAAVAHAPKERVQLAVLENSYHMISADNDRLEVAERLASHTTACLSTNAAPHRASANDALAVAA